MGNVFRDMFKELREKGAGFLEARRSVREEIRSRQSEEAFGRQFGTSFDELVRRAVEPRLERMVLEIVQRHLERLLPDALPQPLWQLAQAEDALGGTGEDPGPLAAFLSRSRGAYWGDPAGDGNEANAFHASMKYDGERHRYTITYAGGTATRIGGESETFPGGSKSSTGANVYAWLVYDPPDKADGKGRWTMKFGTEFPDAEDGAIVVPLWHFDFASGGKGTLTRETEGLVFLPMMNNVVDRT